MIDPGILDQIHNRIVNGDVTASSDLFRLVHAALGAAVRTRVGTSLSWEEAGDAATDAICDYLRAPEKFDGTRARLFGYLTMLARGDALNLLRARQAAAKKVERVVELAALSGNIVEGWPDLKLDAERIVQQHRDELVRDDGDEAVLRLYLESERETSAYAKALGVSDLPASEQQKLVKVRKDRIEQRLRRLREVLK